MPRSEHYGLGDALRASAILLVVFGHVLPDVNFLSAIQPISIPVGYWGVDAFFVLSGFLLGRPYIDALLGRRPVPKASLYARRRFLRIWPAYAVVVLLSAAIENVHHGRHSASIADVVAHLTMLHGFSPAYIAGVGNGPLWTMAVDAQFYVALPIAVWLMLRLTPPDAAFRSRAILASIVGAIALSMAWRLYAVSAIPVQAWPPSPTLFATQRGIVGMGMCFALGGLIALTQALAVEISIGCAAAVSGVGVVLAAVVFTVLFWCPAVWLPFAPTLIDFLGAISVACLLFGGFHLHSTRVGRLFDSRFIAAGAVYAYGLYLVHEPLKLAVWSILEHYHLHFGTSVFSVSLIVLFAFTSIIAAGLLHHIVEQPFLTMKERARETAAS